MTADDLFDDLCRLLREGLVYVDLEDERRPRFGLTPRGRELSSDDRLFRKPTESPAHQVSP